MQFFLVGSHWQLIKHKDCVVINLCKVVKVDCKVLQEDLRSFHFVGDGLSELGINGYPHEIALWFD